MAYENARAHNLPSGVYFYGTTADGGNNLVFVKVKNLMLVK
jgi:hypothetical protein